MTVSTEAEVAEAIRGANGPLRITGGGTRGMAPDAGDALSVAGLTGIPLYEPGALTLVAKAGTPVAEVEAALAAEGQRLAFEPMDHRGLLDTTGTPTIGGVVAANVSGPRRVAVGAARDVLLGVRFVDGTGMVVKNGGRVMKNVTGYDLSRLMAGSRGTLGVLTEVALKVLPVPEAAATVALHGLSDAEAVAAMALALNSPWEVTGAAHLPDEGRTILRLEGFAASVAARAAKLTARLGRDATVEDDAERVAADWRAVRDAAPLHDAPGDVWRIHVRPTDAPALTARLPGDRRFLDWGGGLIWAAVPDGTDLRAALGPFAGHATLVRASSATRARLGQWPPEPEPVRRLTDGLKARFDPRGILNPIPLAEPA